MFCGFTFINGFAFTIFATMQKKPLISVLMPVFNAGPWLEECLQSIVNQTETNWELIAIDDQSTDNSFDILKQFAQENERIQLFKNQSKGIIPALQVAFQHAKGAYITRMDADDLMSADKLESLSTTLSENGPGHLATGWVKYISPTNLGDGYLRYETWLNNLCSTSNHYQDIYRECVIPSPCWMCAREDLIRVGAFDSTTYPEDYDLCFRFYKNGLKVIGIQKVLHFWRDHQERTSRNSPTYADQRYFDLKLPYFLDLDYNPDLPLVLWGTGKKGKLLAQKLIEQQITFHWVTNNTKKIGLNIYDIQIESFKDISKLKTAQAIIAVAAPDDQKEIKQYLKQIESDHKISPFFFC